MDVAGKVLHGTCGWSDPSIVTCGRFYPGAAKTSADKLEVHSRTFGCVEVDVSCISSSVFTCFSTPERVLNNQGWPPITLA